MRGVWGFSFTKILCTVAKNIVYSGRNARPTSHLPTPHYDIVYATEKNTKVYAFCTWHVQCVNTSKGRENSDISSFLNPSRPLGRVRPRIPRA